MYSGSIFACAVVSGSTQLFEKQERHFISRLFAPLREIYIFEQPLYQEQFADYVRIGLNTITPLYKKDFAGIKKLLSKRKSLPNVLLNTSIGDNTFKNVNASNWHLISCLSDTKFIHEGQLRAYLLDFFLSEIKDKGSSILEECECFRKNKRTGRVDYFIKVFEQWIPVEAKLDVHKERNLFAQIAKYMSINSFVPRKGYNRDKQFYVDQTSFCLIFDQLGLYLVSSDRKFKISHIEKPQWEREQFSKYTALQIRQELQRHLIKNK